MNSIKKIIVIVFCLAVLLALTVRIDFLSDPKSVRNIDGNRLVLENGRVIVFTELQYIPTNHVVLAALDSGVEISDDGLAYGLLRMYHYCGNDFVRYDRRRLCINALCVVTDPNCIRQEYLNDNEIKAKVELYLSRPSCSEIKAGRGWPLGNDTYVYTFERELKRVRRSLKKFRTHNLFQQRNKQCYLKSHLSKLSMSGLNSSLTCNYDVYGRLSRSSVSGASEFDVVYDDRGEVRW